MPRIFYHVGRGDPGPRTKVKSGGRKCARAKSPIGASTATTPHQVAILVPQDGLVAQLMAVQKFCTTHAIAYKTCAVLGCELPADFVRFCFGDPPHADAFMAEFGGERITIEPQ